MYPKELFCPHFYSPTLYTSDCRLSPASGCHLQTFSSDSALVGFIHKDNHIAYQQNTNNIVIWCDENHLIREDQGAYYWFWNKTRAALTQVLIKDEGLGKEHQCHISAQERLFFLGCGLSSEGWNRINKLIGKGSIIGMTRDSLDVVLEQWVGRKPGILQNVDHPMYSVVCELKSSSERFRKSLLSFQVKKTTTTLSLLIDVMKICCWWLGLWSN